MITLRVIVKTRGKRTKKMFDEEALIIHCKEHSNIALPKMGKETQRLLKEIIASKAVRPSSTGKLANSFKMYKGTMWVGVGDLSELDKLAPYWRAINFGSAHIVGQRVPTGEFKPGEPEPTPDAFREGRWELGGQFSFIPTQPIEPMNYIEAVWASILSYADKEIHV